MRTRTTIGILTGTAGLAATLLFGSGGAAQAADPVPAAPMPVFPGAVPTAPALTLPVRAATPTPGLPVPPPSLPVPVATPDWPLWTPSLPVVPPRVAMPSMPVVTPSMSATPSPSLTAGALSVPTPSVTPTAMPSLMPSTTPRPGTTPSLPVTTPSLPGKPVATPSMPVPGFPVLPGVQSVLNAGSSLQLATQLFGATNVCVQNLGDVAGVARVESPLGYVEYLPVNAGQLQCVTHSFAGLPVSVSNLTTAPLSVTSKLPMTDHAR